MLTLFSGSPAGGDHLVRLQRRIRIDTNRSYERRELDVFFQTEQSYIVV